MKSWAVLFAALGVLACAGTPASAAGVSGPANNVAGPSNSVPVSAGPTNSVSGPSNSVPVSAGPTTAAESGRSEVRITVPPDTFSTFEVRQLPRSAFPLARPLKVEPTGAAAESPARTSAPSRIPGMALGIVTWDRLAADLSYVRDVPRNGPWGFQSFYGLSTGGVTPIGRTEFQAQIGARSGRSYLSQGLLRWQTFNRVSVTLGDASVPVGTPGLQGVTMRGIKAERSWNWTPVRAATTAGLLIGRSPAMVGNMENAVYPRDLQAVYAELSRSPDRVLRGALFRLADQNGSGLTRVDEIRHGCGLGVSAQMKEKSSEFLGSLYKSALRFEDGAAQDGSNFELRARHYRGNLSVGGTWQATHHDAYMAGPLAALQPVAGSILEGDCSFRRGDASADLWAEKWKESSGRARDEQLLAGESPEALQNLASRSRQIGLRLGQKVPIIGSGLSFSLESRQRTVTSGRQDLVTRLLSLSRNLSARSDATLSWNDLSYRGARSNRYLTGNLNLHLRGGELLTFQQQTEWQEPLGPRIISMGELSGVRALHGRAILSARFTQTYEQVEGRFLPSQTEMQLSGALPLGGGMAISPRYQLLHNSSETVHTFQIGFTRAGEQTPTRSAMPWTDSSQLERQVLRGAVFEDENGDGARDGTERGIPGVLVIVDGDLREPVACDPEGNFRALVTPGRHLVRLLPESIPSAFLLQGLGPTEVQVLVDQTAVLDFPLVRKIGAIEGEVLRQRQGTGVEADSLTSAAGIAGVKVLLGDTDFTFTDAEGRFHFRQLPAGEYTIALDRASLPFGYQVVGDAVRRVTVGAEETTEATCKFVIMRPVKRSEF